MRVLRQIYALSLRECKIFLRNPIYAFCMVAFPLAVIFFFTSLLEQGQPQEMPVGVVDLDNTSTTRTLIRTLDAFQSCEVVAHYATPAEAREAIENNKIYGFLYIPEGTTEKLIASRQPKISFYYTMTTIMSGSLVYRDMKTVATLGSAALGMATMRAKGLTDKQIKTLMQPIAIDLHQIGNPTTDYNAYLTTVMVPGILMLFIFLITAYAIGTELKFNRGKQLVEMGEPHIWVSLIGKFLPHTLVWLTITFFAQRVDGTLVTGLRTLCLWTDAVVAHVHECLLTVGGAQYFYGRLGISVDRYGRSLAGYGVAVPLAPLLHALPDRCPQRLSHP